MAADSAHVKYATPVERVRRMSLETSPQELTDTPSLSLRSHSYAGGLLGPQMSMQTTLDLVLLLLDDIDAGRDVDALRTQQLRNAIFSSEDLQQPLVLRGLTQKHARDASYTGSAVLSFLERTDSMRPATSTSSPASLRLTSSPLASRSQSFALGQL